MVDVIIGVPMYRKGAYVLDKFLANQKEIQQNYPSSELIFATEQEDYIKELEELLHSSEVRGRVLLFDVIKPDYAKGRVWNITCGRESIRQYFVSQADAKFLLCLDGDMICDPNIISIMLKEMHGFDAVYSGYNINLNGAYEMGTGCSLYARDAMKKVRFRCFEFKNNQVILEGCMLELDLIRSGSKIRKGIFLSILHYRTDKRFDETVPQSLGLFRKITGSRFVRYIIIKASIFFKCDISGTLQHFFYVTLKAIKR